MNDKSIGFLLTKASRVVNRMYQKRLQKHGITSPQSNILMTLHNEGEMCQTQIGEALNLDKANTSIMLRRMIDQKIVASTPSREDRRKINIKLSAKGKKLIPVIQKIDEEVSKMLTEIMGVRFRDQSLKILTQIYDQKEEL